MKMKKLLSILLLGSVAFAQQPALNTLTQNEDNPEFIHHWFDRYSISGLINIEDIAQSKKEFSSHHGNEADISAAKLNLDAHPVNWLSGHVGLFYATDSKYYEQGYRNRAGLKVDEAYITLANFDKTPFFARAGEQYLSFGRYYQFPLLTSLTQQLSETKALSTQLGWIAENGTYGSVAVFNGKRRQDGDARTNGVASINYTNTNHLVGVDVGMDYISNMIDVGAISQAISGRYERRVGGVAGHANITAGHFDFGLQYVKALKEFHSQDFAYQVDAENIRGAEPRAGSVKAGYTFTLWDKSNKINTGYQWSREAYSVNADGLQLPYDRWFASYSIRLKQPIILSALIARDKDYSVSNGGTNRVNYMGLGRISVLF
jgi:hypothetical protein